MGTRTYEGTIKFDNQEYKLNIKMLKKHAEHAIGNVKMVTGLPKYRREISGTLPEGDNEGTSHTSILWSPFEDHSKLMPNIDGWKGETAAWLDTLAHTVLTKDNWAMFWHIGQNIFDKYVAVVDNRESAAQIAERKAIIAANEAAHAEKAQKFIDTWTDGNGTYTAPEGTIPVILEVCYDDSDSMTDYFHPHAQYGNDLLLAFVPKQRETERIIRAVVSRYPELAGLDWEWKDQNYSMGKGYFLESMTFVGELDGVKTYGHVTNPPIHYCVSFGYGDKFYAFRGYPGTVAQESKPEIAHTATIGNVKMELIYERDWTWIVFSEKPDESILQKVRNGGGHFSKKRMAWYFTRHVTLDELGLTQL